MNVIYKYRVPFKEVAQVVMHAGANIIRVDGVDGGIYLWAVVDTSKPLVTRTFHLFKTGGEMYNNISEYNYIGCGGIFVQMELMMYLFEYPNSEEQLSPEIPPFNWKDVQEK